MIIHAWITRELLIPSETTDSQHHRSVFTNTSFNRLYSCRYLKRVTVFSSWIPRLSEIRNLLTAEPGRASATELWGARWSQ